MNFGPKKIIKFVVKVLAVGTHGWTAEMKIGGLVQYCHLEFQFNFN